MEREVVLLVDDDVHITASYKRALRREPYEVLTANSASEALGIIKAGGVHAIVTDEEMPELTGTELLRILRASSPDVMRVMLTGKANVHVACGAINIGEVHRFLLKPCSAVEVAVAIRDVLKIRAVQSQPEGMIELLSMQAAYIRHLEEEYPGISKVTTDDNGAILFDMDPEELEQVLGSVKE